MRHLVKIRAIIIYPFFYQSASVVVSTASIRARFVMPYDYILLKKMGEFDQFAISFKFIYFKNTYV